MSPDTGVLSTAEERAEAILTAQEREECFLYFALDCARRARMEMFRLEGQLARGTVEWHIKADEYQIAIANAKTYVANMRKKSWPLDAMLAQMLRSEGIA